MLIANLGVVGFIFTDCDRCTEPLQRKSTENSRSTTHLEKKNPNERTSLLLLLKAIKSISTQPLYRAN